MYEGDEAVFACSPFMEYQPVVLIRQDLTILTKETEPRLCYRNFVIADSPSLSNRTYTLKDVSREDDSRTFRCVIGDIISNRVTLRVYGEKIGHHNNAIAQYFFLLKFHLH